MDKKTLELINEFRRQPKNVDFDNLVKVCTKLFGERRAGKGSHTYQFKTGLRNPHALVNLQRAGKHAKPYQVKQVLIIVGLRYGGEDENG